MSIADELNKMIPELEDAYQAIAEVGGTVPEQKNYKNLKTAIESISPDPLANVYAVLYTPGSDLEWDTVEDANSVRAVMNGSSYWQNPNNHTHLKFTAKCRELTDIVKIGNSSAATTLSTNMQVVEGLSNFINVTEIGTGFMYNSARTSYFLTAITDWPEKLTTIGNDFLRECRVFDSGVSLPRVTTVGNNFMYTCQELNSPVSLPSLTSMGTFFLASCRALNSPVTFGPVTVLNTSFMANDSAFDQPLTDVSHVQTIGASFLYGASAFNQPLDFPEVRTIGNEFMRGASGFNSTLNLGAGLTSIGTYLLSGASSFTQPLTIPESVTSIGDHFMYSANAFTGYLYAMTSTTPPGDYSLASSSSSATSYTTGISLTGPYASAWKAALPDRTSAPYRKLYASDSGGGMPD